MSCSRSPGVGGSLSRTTSLLLPSGPVARRTISAAMSRGLGGVFKDRLGIKVQEAWLRIEQLPGMHLRKGPTGTVNDGHQFLVAKLVHVRGKELQAAPCCDGKHERILAH